MADIWFDASMLVSLDNDGDEKPPAKIPQQINPVNNSTTIPATKSHK